MAEVRRRDAGGPAYSLVFLADVEDVSVMASVRCVQLDFASVFRYERRHGFIAGVRFQ